MLTIDKMYYRLLNSYIFSCIIKAVKRFGEYETMETINLLENTNDFSFLNKIRRDQKYMQDSIHLTFDGEKYTILSKKIKDYPIGGLICEFLRMPHREIVDIIHKIPNKEHVPADENLKETIEYFAHSVTDKFSPVIASVLLTEFNLLLLIWNNASQTDSVESITKYINNSDEITYKYFPIVFQESKYNNYGTFSVEQLFLSVYCHFLDTFIDIERIWSVLQNKNNLNVEGEKSILNFFFLHFREPDFLMYSQKIIYRILDIDGKLSHVYSICNSMSLMLFEYVNMTNKKDLRICKCKNCNHYFVIDGRCDTLYCGYPSPQNKSKTCKVMGAQIARSNKEKNDIVTYAYRKIYMRCNMRAKRHPEDIALRYKFYELSDGMRQWRTNLKNGSETTESFLAWLKKFE